MTATNVLSCREIVEIVTDYLEGDLDRATATALETHLELCPGCLHYLDQLRETIAITGNVSSDSLPAETQAGLLEAFRTFRPPVTDLPDNK